MTSLGFEEGLNETNQWLDGVESQLKDFDLLDLSEENIQDVICRLREIINQLDNRVGVLKDLQADGVELKEKQVCTLARLSDLHANFSERFSETKDIESKVIEFNTTLKKLNDWLVHGLVTLNSVDPVALDADVIKEQMKELEPLLEMLDRQRAMMVDLKGRGRQLLRDGHTSTDVINQSTNELEAKWNKLLRKLTEQQKINDDWLLKQGQTSEAAHSMLAWLQKVKLMNENQMPYQVDNAGVSKQMEAQKVLRKELESCQQLTSQLTNEGHSLADLINGKVALEIREAVNRNSCTFDSLSRKIQSEMDKSKMAQEKSNELVNELKELEAELVNLQERSGKFGEGASIEEQQKSLDEKKRTAEEMENVRRRVKDLNSRIRSMSRSSSISEDLSSKKTQQTLNDLASKWNALKNKSEERKNKLLEASQQVTEYHDLLNSTMDLLTNFEHQVSTLKPVSRHLDTVLQQIEQHKHLQQELNKHRNVIHDLETIQSQLKNSGSRQDQTLLKNLTANQNRRWEKLRTKCSDRTRQLENGLKEARIFYDAWKSLHDWLVEMETNLSNEPITSSDLDTIRQEVNKHKDFQRILASKQHTLDSLLRMGRSIRDKSIHHSEVTGGEKLNEMIAKLKGAWLNVCGKSVDRQKQLEDALLLAGKFKEAMDVLLDWLYKVEPRLGEMEPVHGDVDTVNSLTEQHKIFQKELMKKTSTVAAVREAAKQLLMTSPTADDVFVQSKLIDMTAKWNEVCRLSVCRQEKLKGALKMASRIIILLMMIIKDFHNKSRQLLSWLLEAEKSLRLQSPTPAATNVDMEDHFNKLLQQHQVLLFLFSKLAEQILQQAHPEAIPTIRNWNNTVKSRLNDVTSASNVKGKRLREAVQRSRSNAVAMDSLMMWLEGVEAELSEKMGIYLPRNIPILEQLKQDHTIFESDLMSRQQEVEKFSTAEYIRFFLFQLNTRKKTPTSQIQTAPPLLPPATMAKDHRAVALFNKWRRVWLQCMERHKNIQDLIDTLEEVYRLDNFDFDVWRMQYTNWMRLNKSRTMDFFYRQDKDRDGRVTRKEFIEGVLKSGFRTTPLEMEKVADKFDFNQDGYIDYREFVAALRWPDKRSGMNGRYGGNLREKIKDEVDKQAKKCHCPKQFNVDKIGNDRYRFGESQKLRLVRILRSTVMVRVGGGWVALDEFLVKNDPCRAKGRTNSELRDPFFVPIGASSAYANFKSKTPSKSLGDVSQQQHQQQQMLFQQQQQQQQMLQQQQHQHHGSPCSHVKVSLIFAIITLSPSSPSSSLSSPLQQHHHCHHHHDIIVITSLRKFHTA
ncbi:hypothetical protein HELRODRAFT_79805 [Helobdella robusta]|uniref:Dystonin n=1 Tax=Helobdella robusta TaxID=6412 RepID=T1G3T6_HELRO|nr:hypothetical protein HELRODRAFT_79805 [Helobdella robusta]ESO03758.1 hypothetical protein HELRODRAFT_79805 [Helobdella robusta]